jgi:hypothetical protein
VPSNRVANLRAALAAVLVNAAAPEVTLVHRWLGTWTGIGLIAVKRWKLGGLCASSLHSSNTFTRPSEQHHRLG